MQMFKTLGMTRLLAFKTVYEKRSLKVAGEDLNLSTSALSMHISAMENAVEERLFDRKAGFEPTPKCIELYEATLEFFTQINNTVKPKDVDPYLERSVFTIGGDNYYKYLLATFVINAISSWDQAMVITRSLVQNPCGQLLDNQLDAYISMGQPETPPSLKSVLLFKESYWICVHERTIQLYDKDHAATLPIITNTDIVKRLPRDYRARVAHVMDDKTVPENLCSDANYGIIVPNTTLLSSHSLHVIERVPSLTDEVYLTYFDDYETNRTRRMLIDVIVNALSPLSARN